jgi:hypothetical protein
VAVTTDAVEHTEGAEAPGPVPDARPAWHRPAAVGAAVACGCAAVALWNPGDGGTPLCWSQSVLGIDCPLCGGLRATNALLRGDWAAAADHNVLLAVLLPLAAVAWLAWLICSVRGKRFPVPRLPSAAWIGIGVALIVFTVVRNVGGNPVFDWLAATASGAPG